VRDFQQTENRIRRSVVSAATELGLQASFADGRRESDIMVIRLRGNRKDTVFLSQQLKEIFPTVDIDVLQGKKHDGNIMTMIVTRPLTEQEAAEDMERRAKLRFKKRQHSNKIKQEAKNKEVTKEAIASEPVAGETEIREAHEDAMARIPKEEQPIGYDYRKVIN